MRRLHTLSSALIFGFLVLTLPAWAAPVSLKIDFDSKAGYVESDDVAGTAKPSGLTAAQKQSVIALVQKKYDDALGAGVVTVSEGKGGDYDIIANGDQAPGKNKGNEYGDCGKPGRPGVAHVGEFVTDGYKDQDLINAVGETIAHEAAHKLGLNHNTDSPPSLMTDGKGVTGAVRKKDDRKFTDNDIKELKKNTNIKNAEKKTTTDKKDLSVFRGASVNFIKGDDDYLDASTIFSGTPGAEFGYISADGEFVFVGDYTNTSSNSIFTTFEYTAGEDIALNYGGTLYTLENGGATFTLSDPNPYNPAVFQIATITFATPGDPAVLTFDANVVATTGGFTAVPEPSALLLLGAGTLTGFGVMYRRKRIHA